MSKKIISRGASAPRDVIFLLILRAEKTDYTPVQWVDVTFLSYANLEAHFVLQSDVVSMVTKQRHLCKLLSNGV